MRNDDDTTRNIRRRPPETPVIPELFDPLAGPFRLEGTNDEAVVLLHGFTGVAGHFRPLGQRLHEAGFTVNVPLLAGHGTNRRHMASTGHREWIRSAELAVRAVAGHRRVHVVGLSMGGLLGIIVAARHAVSTITTINSPIVVRDPQLYLSPFASRLVPDVGWDSERPLSGPEDLARYDLTYSGFPSSSARDLLRIMARGYRWARRLRRPSLVIQSRVDETVHWSSGHLLAQALGPDTALFWLERSRHNALLDHEHALVDAAVLGRIQHTTPS